MSVLESHVLAICRRQLKMLQELMSGDRDHEVVRHSEYFKVSKKASTRELAIIYQGAIGALDDLAYDPDAGLSRQGRETLRVISAEALELISLLIPQPPKPVEAKV